MESIRCHACKKKLAETASFSGELVIKCNRCKAINSLRVMSPSPDSHSATITGHNHGQTTPSLPRCA
ncbi:MAG: Com family DNA-binding transcriptional regulator [Alphaproteobacteria bacterium]|nr:Com family DNA-binding transcriptional regulator [Alphaproteobacteria bacterium]